MSNSSQSQQQKENQRNNSRQQTLPLFNASLSRLFHNHHVMVGAHFQQTQRHPWKRPPFPIPSADNNHADSTSNHRPNALNPQKARLVRQIEVKISMLESKSKQPGIKNHDLQPLGQQIYDKLDQYFINFGTQRDKHLKAGLQEALHERPSADPGRPDHAINFRSSKPHKRQHSMLSESDISRINPSSSNFIVEESNKEQGGMRKFYHTTANLSFSSVSDLEQDNEERPFFEIKMEEQDLQGLNQNVSLEVSDRADPQNLNESYFELKQSIRVMEERIAFLIHRLEENKKEVVFLKEQNRSLQLAVGQEQRARKEARRSLEEKSMQIVKLQDERKSMEKKLKLVEKQKIQVQQLNDSHEKQLIELKQQIDFLKGLIGQKQTRLEQLDGTVGLKAQQVKQLTQAYINLEREEQTRRHYLLTQLQDAEKEKKQLISSLKECKARIQAEGLSFNIDEAQTLKQLIQNSDRSHQRQIKAIKQQYNQNIRKLESEVNKLTSEKSSLEQAICRWIKTSNSNSSELDCGVEGIGLFKGMVDQFETLVNQNTQLKADIQKYLDRIDILKQECQDKYNQLGQLFVKSKEQEETIERLAQEKAELVQYLSEHVCQPAQPAQNSSKTSRLANSKLQSRILSIKLGRSTQQYAQMTLQYFLKKKPLNSVSSVLSFAVKLISFALELQETHKKKLPSLAPHAVLLNIRSISDLEISFSLITKKEEEEGLMYQAPEIVLGFNQSGSSHCWIIGLIIDELLHGRRYFKAFTEILSHKDNYSISDQKYRKLSVLGEMIRKNHKARISLEGAKSRFQEYLVSLKSKR